MKKPSIEKQVDIMVKLALIFLISLLSFAVGTFVGRNVAESEYRKANIEKNSYKNLTTSSPSEENIQRLTEKFMKSEKERLMKAVPKKHQVDKKPSPKAQRDLSTVVTGTATKPLIKYTLQVAAYPTEMEAKKQIEKLRSMGHEAFSSVAQVKGRKWYRVNVGRFDDKSRATQYRTQLIKSSPIKDAIIKKI